MRQNNTLPLFKSQGVAPARRYVKLGDRFSGEFWERDRPHLVSALERRGEYKLAQRIAHCRKKVMVMKCRAYFQNAQPDHDSEWRLPYSCHTSACPVCSKVYAKKKVKEFLEYVGALEVPKGYVLQFGTLTKKVRFNKTGDRELPDAGALKEFFRQVRTFTNEFFPRRTFTRKNRKGAVRVERPGKCGAVGVLEIGRGKNVHVHLLAIGPVYSRSAMARRWKEITGDSYIVEFDPVRQKLGSASPDAAVRYILKYIRKPMAFDSFALTAEMLVLMKNLRRLHTFGVFYNPRAVGGALEGRARPEKLVRVCDTCQNGFAFYAFDDKQLWWDEDTYRLWAGIDSS